ncbi:FRG domain-containing protein [Paenibacillus peoriae]|uniref:FRG domain-containing protein n=1 Tax=Paenibacillus peoriae TaxID=59893 RepID=UPI003F978AD2
MEVIIPWTESEVQNGFISVKFKAFIYFEQFIFQHMLDSTDYIWRGQKCESWKLETTLDRYLRKAKIDINNANYQKHLENFKYSSRGRRGKTPPTLGSENDWWALGQHYGLATPLLDWSTSPFVAAFFAFSEENNETDEYRAIYALTTDVIDDLKLQGKESQIEFIKPLSDENSRLVNQSGLFTRIPMGEDIKRWVEDNYIGDMKRCILYQFLIPNDERKYALQQLNRMNINHLTLFPDLQGTSYFCNLALEINKY